MKRLLWKPPIKCFASGNPDPVSLPYPSFIVYLDVAALRLYYKVGEFLGRYDRRLDMLFDMVVLRPRFHYRVARTVNLVFGVATVALVYLLATTTFQTRDTGWLAALLLGTSLLHVIYSRFATVDVVTTFLATAAVLFAVRAASSSKTSSYVVAGMFAGLAASSKYNAAVVVSALVLPVVAVLFGGEAKERTRSLSNLAVAGLVTVLVFAVTSPFVVLHYEEVYRFVTHMGRVLTDAPDELALWVHLRDTFPRGLGWPFFAAAVVGLGRAGWRRRPEDLALVGFAVVYFAAIAGARIVYPRYVLPLIPVLAAFAAESSVWLAARFRHRAAATAIASRVCQVKRQLPIAELIQLLDQQRPENLLRAHSPTTNIAPCRWGDRLQVLQYQLIEFRMGIEQRRDRFEFACVLQLQPGLT